MELSSAPETMEPKLPLLAVPYSGAPESAVATQLLPPIADRPWLLLNLASASWLSARVTPLE
ncbi:hypothetical protein D3C78_1930410 [compost metagenome]